MQESLENEYFKLLLLNSQNELEVFVSRNGKVKSICPIRFIEKEDEKTNKKNNNI